MAECAMRRGEIGLTARLLVVFVDSAGRSSTTAAEVRLWSSDAVTLALASLAQKLIVLLAHNLVLQGLQLALTMASKMIRPCGRVSPRLT
jgi:hypothetical protein